jgi:proton glutamate symport protein
LIVSTLASETRLPAIGKLSARAIGLFALMLAAVSTLGALLAPPIMNALTIDATSASSLRTAAASTKQPDLPGFSSWLVGLVPANPIKAAADGAMLPVIVFAVVFALALARAREDVRTPATGLFRAIADTMLVIVQWVLALAPIGVFALIVSLAAQVGASVAGAVAYYIVVHSALLVLVALLLYVVVRLAGGIPFARFARAVLPAQVVAVTTRSSLAALPAMIDGAKRVLGIREEVASFALPFGVSLLRLNTCMSWIVGALFVAKLYGLPLGAREIAIVAAAGVPMSFSVPGIPSGGLFVLAPLFMAVSLPLEGIGILIALDAIPDMFKTLVNVTGQMTATTVLARMAPGEQHTG